MNGHFSGKCNSIQIRINFSRKSNAGVYLPVDLNNSPVQLCESHKHLGILLDKHLNFHEHVAKKTKIRSKLIGTIKNLSFHLPRKSSLTIYKSFVRPHFDYDDIIYDNTENEALINKLEKVQYQACLPITGAFQSTSRESLYSELGLECLQTRRWYRKMIFFYKILNALAPNTYMIFCLYLRTGTTVQETKQSWNLVNSLPELKVLVTLSFPTALRNGTS